MKADKLSYSAPSLTTRMIMKSEKPEEEENNVTAAAIHRDVGNSKQHQQQQQQQQQQLVDKMVSSSQPNMAGLPGYYINGMGMQSIARLGRGRNHANPSVRAEDLFSTLNPTGLAYSSSSEQVPGLVRPISTTAPLQFNNNNSVHVVNPSIPAYPLPPSYGLNLSSKSTDAKAGDVKDDCKRTSDGEEANRLNSTNSGETFFTLV